ncbi:MAG: ferritin-like domain-containing protein [Neisseriaceae bacterium]|nr:ferritin-like domain-containing protein [Neisseriaceae bacterium]
MQIYPALEQALMCPDPVQKCGLVNSIVAAVDKGQALFDVGLALPYEVPVAGQPTRPLLVPPQSVARRKLSSREGHAAMVHALCHIEFNAINLGLDAAWRFRLLPPAFLQDWLRVASEEAKHFMALKQRLQKLGFDYGDFDAHNHLWAMADKTAYDPLVRMALVPRVLEARGLDVTPGIQAKLTSIGDAETVAILDMIYAEEKDHVAIGNRWFAHLCQQRGLDPLSVFKGLLKRYDVFVFRGYFNVSARTEAGFSAFELSMLQDFQEGHDALARLSAKGTPIKKV